MEVLAHEGGVDDGWKEWCAGSCEVELPFVFQDGLLEAITPAL